MLTERENPLSAGASIIRVASDGNADGVKALLAKGADVDQRGRGGHTALMVAAIFSHIDIARLLLAAGADVELQDDLGLTAKDWADRRGSWDVAQLLLNAPTAGIEHPPKQTSGKLGKPRAEAERRNPEVEPKDAPQQDVSPTTEDRMRTKADPQRGVLEEEVHPSGAEPPIARPSDAVRFLKFHKQIMAAQAQRKAEQEHHEAEEVDLSSPVGPKTTSQQDSRLSEQGVETARPSAQEAEAVPTHATEKEAVATRQEREAVPTHWLELEAVATRLAERAAAATRSTTGASRQVEEVRQSYPIETHNLPKLEDLKVTGEQQKIEAQPARQEKEARPTAKQLARIAATVEHLRLLEEPSKRSDSEVPEKSESTARTAVERALDSNDPDTTLERHFAEMPNQPAVLKPKIVEPFIPPPFKSCPECKTVFDNPHVKYCAYDGTKLTRADDPITHSAGRDWSRQTLLALVAIITVLGGFLGYLINSYRSREIADSAGVAASLTPNQTDQDETTPVISGTLTGMEVDLPKPEYPAKARAEGVSGTIEVRVQVNKKGKVVSARSSGGDRRLRTAAVEAARRTTFSPEKLAVHGKLVSGTITYNFVAPTEPPAATGSPVSSQTNSPSANESSSSATDSPTSNVGGDYPVTGGPLAGAESNLPQPDYPEDAKRKGVSGPITVVVRVNRVGKVISWRTLEGDPRLRAAALKAARKATFSPAKLPAGGEVVGTIMYTFK